MKNISRHAYYCHSSKQQHQQEADKHELMVKRRSCSSSSTNISTKTIDAASKELEILRFNAMDGDYDDGVDFPVACRELLFSLPGNSHCIDCGSARPEWASVTYGCLLCLQCSGKHRSYGVRNSFVRSVTMDTWTHLQVLTLLEGGNQQLKQFFHRHKMVDNVDQRYHTKGARFYRIHLAKHVQDVALAGVYQGREASRKKHTCVDNQHSKQPMTQPDARAKSKHIEEHERDSASTAMKTASTHTSKQPQPQSVPSAVRRRITQQEQNQSIIIRC